MCVRRWTLNGHTDHTESFVLLLLSDSTRQVSCLHTYKNTHRSRANEKLKSGTKSIQLPSRIVQLWLCFFSSVYFLLFPIIKSYMNKLLFMFFFNSSKGKLVTLIFKKHHFSIIHSVIFLFVLVLNFNLTW